MKKFFLCYFETTRRCNLSCPYCMTGGPIDGGASELTEDEAKHLVLDELKRYSSKAAVAFSGGEFLLREDALDLLAYNAQLGQWSFINTSGILLTRQFIAEIKSATRGNIVFVFSIDTLQPGKGAVTRQGKLDTIEEKTRLCKELGVPYFFIVTISKSNLGELKEVMEFATRDGVPVLRSPLVPRGKGADFKHLMFDKQDMRDVIHPVLRDTYLSYISFVPFFAAPTFFQKNWIEAKIAIKQLGCQAGRGYAGISAEGDVAPCVHLLDSGAVCGNVRETPLSTILRENSMLLALRERTALKGKCGRCKYKDTCGGCRALAYYDSGDVLGEDPTCFFEPDDSGTQSELEKRQNENVGRFGKFISSHAPWKNIF